MNKKKPINLLLIFTATILLITIGIAATIIFSNRNVQEEFAYDTKFGILNAPLDYALDYDISTTKEFEDVVVENLPAVYQIDKENEYYPSVKLAEKLADSFGLKLSVSKGEDRIFSDEETISLEFDSELNTITYRRIAENTLAALPTPEDAKLLARVELEDLNLWPYAEDQTVERDINYYEELGFNFYDSNDETKANLIGVVFRNTFNNYPLVVDNSHSGEIEVILNANSEIVRIVYRYRPISINNSAKYPLNTSSEAYQYIRLKKCEVILPYEVISTSSVSLQSAILAYKIELFDQDYLQPVYLFEGTDQDENLVSIIVPAITDDYLEYPE